VRGWYRESYRHALAARGIKTSDHPTVLVAKGRKSFDGGARYSDDLEYNLDWKESELKFLYKPQSVILTKMSPELFLKLAVELMPLSGDPYHTKLINARTRELRDRIASGKGMDVLWLSIEDGSTCGRDGCSVVRHDGRHRAKAAIELGIKKIPVAIYFHDCDDNLSDPKSSLKVKDQNCLTFEDGHYRGVIKSEWRHGYVSSLDPDKPGKWVDIGGHPVDFEAESMDIQWNEMPEAKENLEDELGGGP
jgi:hypothetical protein